MIVGKQKPFDEIWDMVKGFKKVLVFGCNTCVAISHAGGGKEAEILASMLRMKATQENLAMQVDNAAIERHCEPEFFEPLMEKVRTYDLVLSTACGVGVNFLSERIGDIPVYPGVNTTFFGAVPKAGFFVELCGGMRQLHPPHDRRHLPGGALLQVAHERALRRHGQGQMRGQQGSGLRLVPDRGADEEARQARGAVLHPAAAELVDGNARRPAQARVEHILELEEEKKKAKGKQNPPLCKREPQNLDSLSNYLAEKRETGIKGLITPGQAETRRKA